jgi:AAA domain
MLNVTTGKVYRPQKILLYGIEKVGKSSLAAKFPAPLFLDVEEGTHQLDLHRLNINTANELDTAISQVAREQHNYKTLVIDSVDWAEKLLADRVLVENKWKSIETPNYGKGFIVLREAFKRFLDNLKPVTGRGIHIVLIGHAQIKKYSPPEASDGYDRWELKLDKDNTLRAKEWADAILFANFETKVVGSGGKTRGIGGHERVIYTMNSAAWDAGNRHGLPEKIGMNIEDLAPLFEAATEATETERPAFVLDKETVLQKAFEGLDHEQLTAFLVDREQLQPNQSIFEISDEYAHRIALDPVRFQGAVRRHKQAAEFGVVK